jgi:NTP pyrophosphatase (non-canonical NTP hydrolase)
MTTADDFKWQAAEVRFADSINQLQSWAHGAQVAAGWWTSLADGSDLRRPGGFNVGEKLMLVVSEIAEAMEGARKSLNDDKLPHRPMLEVELVDAMIRIFDLAGAMQLDLAGAFVEKMAYNAKRADHTIAARKLQNGKAF